MSRVFAQEDRRGRWDSASVVVVVVVVFWSRDRKGVVGGSGWCWWEEVEEGKSRVARYSVSAWRAVSASSIGRIAMSRVIR